MSEIKGKILIVDDEESIRRIFRQTLEEEGFYCVAASSGQEALEKASQEEFHIVLLDVKMPGMSGLEVLSKLSADYPDTCVIMVTAMTDSDTAVAAMKLGAYDYVTKPFNLAELTGTVDRALERRRLVLENRNYQARLEEMVEHQRRQLQAQFSELIQSLAREQIALQELESMRQAEGVEPASRPPGLGQQAASVTEFADQLIQLMQSRFPETGDWPQEDQP